MASLRPIPVFTLAALLLSAAGLVFPPHTAAAQNDTARYELIAEVNGLRASWGLLPYTVDAGVTAIAQDHAAYLAEIHHGSHQHRDGSYPPDLGVVENVAEGDIGWLDPHTAVYEVWSGLGHLRTMVAFAEGSMGVGIADDGKTVFYVLEVRPTAESAATAGPGPDFPRLPTVSQSQLTPLPRQPLVTATPRPDGSLIHVVGYGQTLWDIALAYGVTIDQIRAWNGIAPDSSDIYEGQKLLVRPPQPTAAAGKAVSTPSLAAGSSPSPAPTGAGPNGDGQSGIWPPEVGPHTPPATGIMTTRSQPASSDTAPPGTLASPGSPARSAPPGSILPALAGISILSGLGLFILAVVLRRPGRDPGG